MFKCRILYGVKVQAYLIKKTEIEREFEIEDSFPRLRIDEENGDGTHGYKTRIYKTLG